VQVSEHSPLASLLPAAAATAEIIGAYAASLLPEECFALGRAAEKRRHEFALGRACARQAIRKLGFAPTPILRGAGREPLWPPGLCGSITHCEGYCAAVAARQRELRCVGIDVERIQELEAGVFELIASTEERAWITCASPWIPWGVLLFSAKESVFKAWFPIARTWLDFHDVRIEIDPCKPHFRALVRPEVPGPSNAPKQLVGRFHLDGERVKTSAFVLA